MQLTDQLHACREQLRAEKSKVQDLREEMEEARNSSEAFALELKVSREMAEMSSKALQCRLELSSVTLLPSVLSSCILLLLTRFPSRFILPPPCPCQRRLHPCLAGLFLVIFAAAHWRVLVCHATPSDARWLCSCRRLSLIFSCALRQARSIRVTSLVLLLLTRVHVDRQLQVQGRAARLGAYAQGNQVSPPP